MTSSKTAAARKRPLTLAQLSAYDDILTDALVDHVYYWTTVPKNRPSYHPSRGVREDEVSKIIQEEVVLRKDLAAGESRLLATDGLGRFSAALPTDKERSDFHGHLRRYLRMYLPDCPWEVSSTNRYTIVTHEACVTARRYIRRNETIKYLSGIQVVITPAEEREIASRKKDFSIVVSSRNKCTSMFMGPARFANHDCQANAKLITTSHSEIEIVASRPIEVGEEITVTYGDSYFGEDNRECLCLTCENELRNGWQPEQTPEDPRADRPGKHDDSYSLRRRPRDGSIGSSRTPSVTPDVRPRIFKSKGKTKLNNDATEPCRAASATPEAALAAAAAAALAATSSQPRHKRNGDHMATPPITPAKKIKQMTKKPACPSMPSFSSSLPTFKPLAKHATSRDSSVTTESNSQSGGNAQEETDVTSPEEESPEPQGPFGKTTTTTTTTTTMATMTTTPPNISSCDDADATSGRANPDAGGAIVVEPFSPQSLNGQASPPGMPIAMPIPIAIPIPIPIPILPKVVAAPALPLDAAAMTRSAMSLANILNGPFQQRRREPDVAATAIMATMANMANMANMAMMTTITPSIEVVEKDREITPEEEEAEEEEEQEGEEDEEHEVEEAQEQEQEQQQQHEEEHRQEQGREHERDREHDHDRDDKEQAPRPTRKYERRVFLKHSTPPARARTRGDYQLTPLLLSEPDMAWIQCTNCGSHFVQQNAYFTRSSCPRCERHSKLYGYAWPKTDRAGPGDKEERVLDHRTIHRFLDPNDERRARGRKLLAGEARDSDESDVPTARGRRIDRKSHRARAKAQAEAQAQAHLRQETSSDTSPAGVRRSSRMRRLSSRLSEAIGL